MRLLVRIAAAAAIGLALLLYLSSRDLWGAHDARPAPRGR